MQAAGVHADANRYAAVRASERRALSPRLSQVAGIETQSLDAGFEGREGISRGVDVGDDRHRRTRTIWASPSAAATSLHVQARCRRPRPRARRSAERPFDVAVFVVVIDWTRSRVAATLTAPTAI